MARLRNQQGLGVMTIFGFVAILGMLGAGGCWFKKAFVSIEKVDHLVGKVQTLETDLQAAKVGVDSATETVVNSILAGDEVKELRKEFKNPKTSKKRKLELRKLIIKKEQERVRGKVGK